MTGRDVSYQSGTDHIIGWNIPRLRIKCTALYVVYLDTQFPILLAEHSQQPVLKARGGKKLLLFYRNIRVHLYTSNLHCVMIFFNQFPLIISWIGPVQEIIPAKAARNQ